MEKRYLALDLGGTKLMIGEVEGSGHIVRSKQYPTGYCSQEEAMRIVIASLDDYLKDGYTDGVCPEAMGVGLIGRIDCRRGEWLQIDTSRDIVVPMAQILSERYSLPCFIDNDVKSATRAEMSWGCGRDTSNFVYINIGTGIAAGAVVDGRIVRGAHYDAGEVGYMISNVGAASDMERENIENVASGHGFDLQARRLIGRDPNTCISLPSNGRIDVRSIYEGYLKGDALCRYLVVQAAEAIATLFTNMIRAFDPECIVVGGGIVADGMMLALVEQLVQPNNKRFLSMGVVATRLDPRYAGLLGAAAVAMDGIGKKNDK